MDTPLLYCAAQPPHDYTVRAHQGIQAITDPTDMISMTVCAVAAYRFSSWKKLI